MKSWFDSGEPWIWLNAGAVSLSVIMVTGLVVLIAVRGLGHFWPGAIAVFDYQEQDGSRTQIMGEFVDHEQIAKKRLGGSGMENIQGFISRFLIKTGNRDFTGLDFRWVEEASLAGLQYPEAVMLVERREWGNFYGYLRGIRDNGQDLSAGTDLWDTFQEYIRTSEVVFDQIRHIEKDRIGSTNYRMERLRLEERGLEIKGIPAPGQTSVIAAQRRQLQQEYDVLTVELARLYQILNKTSIVAMLADGREIEIPLARIVRAYRPNGMNLLQKTGFYFEKLWEFLADEPREANTEGGIFPAIFGTVMMVIIMAIIVTPFGVIAAIYLHEYAKQGPLTRLIRIAVNNLAGVPSIVYGVFGLGFFVYFLGGRIDQLFFPESLPAPTFGTPGLLWASLTLALLTVPVVIVATEEGLSRVPRTIREGSLALGATKFETLWLTVLPMTASAMMTGLILAVARAAGEVAPLMLVGVVKLAPSLPLDGNLPYLHLDRKFMHLGFHIYDVGFQSPNVEAARPLVYSTALLLVIIIIVLNLAAIRIRNRLREKYRAAEQH
ncbi:MAG: phosphate ABC transporter, permease protein PstA [Gammaproteobacteria bacterium RBG_16_51_14]|nr:MAG: phosphate ABC transporter, permease protein PstA [Gammaproteobacteria bacterium RBG_16_51_14]